MNCKRVGVVLLALLSGLAADAQFVGIPGMVGVPFNYDALGDNPLTTVLGAYTITLSLPCDASTVPPGLTESPTTGIFTGIPTTPGGYTVSCIVVHSSSPSQPGFPIMGATTVPISITGGTGPAVTVLTGGLSFNLIAGAAPAQKPVPITSHSSTPQTFQASATGGSFLTVSGSGSLAAFGQSSVTVTVDPSKLAPGTYTGTVAISGSFTGSPLTVPVVVSVTAAQPLLSLSQTGLFFRTSAGGPAPPAQSFTIANSGVGTLNWTTAASTFSGGAWLSASPASGQSTATSSPAVSVQVNPAGLAAGTYYGQVQVSAPGAPNTPQSVAVVLSVAASAVNVDPDIRPTGLIFVGKQGGPNPAAQQVQLTNLGSTPVNYTSSIFYDSGSGWLSVNPASGTIVSGTPSTPTLTAAVGTLAPGIYQSQVTFVFTGPGTTHTVTAVLIVLPAGSLATPEESARAAGACTPTKLLPLFSLLGQSFSTSAAWPVSLQVTVADDCGNPITTGSVVASFSSGDAPISLASLNNGQWSGTWTPGNTTTASLSITATAQTVNPALSGTATIGGNSNANPGVPIVTSGGVVNAASNAPSTPVAPGSYISIYGSALGSGLTIASAPFPAELGGTQVLLAGQPVPLYFTSSGQINALVPYGLVTDTTTQVVVARGGAYSTPAPLTLADGGPAVFLNQGAGIAEVVKPDGTYFLVDSTHPTTAGDALVIYCAGLGAVTPSLQAGTVSSTTTLANTTNAVTVTIEGIPAQVLFAGLAPGFAGLYQVNVVVPSGLTASTSAPLVISVAGQSSPTAVANCGASTGIACAATLTVQ